MGVRGLFSFAENKFDCFESTTLKDTKLIIDGNNLRFFLYKRTKKRRCSFGGEYLLYFNATRDYFNRYVSICTCKLFYRYSIFVSSFKRVILFCNSSLICHNIIPIVIFDGSYEDGKKKTTWKRTREQLHSALRHNPTHDSIDSILPIFSKGRYITFLKLLLFCTKRKFRNIAEFFSFFKTTNANINYHNDKNSCSNANENAK